MTASSFIDISRRGGIVHVEIPILQRDYAQGRRSTETDRIRKAFLAVVGDALIDGESLHLDFVYGHIVDRKLVPLDGQQRLTTLFLLHWYIAARANLDAAATNALPRLTYETRHSSRRFCELIIQQRPFPLPEFVALSTWIRDQRWFASSWRRDPTIASMLVVIDDLHALLGNVDAAVAWGRLTDEGAPAITFDFLPVEKLGLSDDLYIKMNSRGKPLTPFENFKAEFEAMVRDSESERYEELTRKIDNEWTDLFWQARGDDDQVDDAFLRYFRFVTDIIETRAEIELDGDDLERARGIYAGSPARLNSLFDAFDAWSDKKPRAILSSLFVARGHQPGKTTLFDDVDLLRACATSYVSHWFGGRGLPLWKLLVLFGVVEHLRLGSPDFPRRARVLRNVVLNSSNELREDALAKLLEETAELVSTGALAKGAFNHRQVGEEQRKALLLSQSPDRRAALERLEDHPLLRGCLVAFDLEAPEFAQRAATFDGMFAGAEGLPVAGVKAAWLACGDYSQPTTQSGRFSFGAQSAESWRGLLTRGGERTRLTLAKLLDEAGARPGTLRERLEAITTAYLAERESFGAFDWRYYLVKYDEMRDDGNGQYLTDDGGAIRFRFCMLHKERLNGYYRDPFLLAIYRRSAAATDAHVPDPWFRGYADKARWMEITGSGVALRNEKEGLRVRAPWDAAYADAFDAVASTFGLDDDGRLTIQQSVRDGITCDGIDRVLVGVELMNALLAMEPATDG